ncbi:MAG TPA: exonuclease domain-containing protein [Bacteroidia bacterium]|jgi:DNA polymerase-3 subunit epsilon|nr:exonuclease domain-containing protein [Bacteroidia bacterium]
MFAIIDIETCGGKFEYRRGHIIDICILIHDGLQVVDKFSTLINPQCNITPFYTKLSGITNEMVKDAPTFPEVAKKIIEITEGKIFVAHNVGFDYGFVKEEFAALGYKYKRDTLCTVRLSRKLIPGKLSYSLGKLCDSLGIENKARHRAEGDAEATVILFNKLLELKAMDPKHKNKGVDELMVRRIDKIKEYILKKLPEDCGVYYFRDKDGEIIYIGKSGNMYNRALSHFNTHEKKGKKMLNDLYNVDFVLTGSELIALLLESEEIKKYKPKYNRMRKASEFTHSIDTCKDDKGIITFKITSFKEANMPLVSFNNYAAARERLEQWIDEYALCMRYCNLVSEDAVCFNHQIKKCRGICAGEEEIEQYNKRANEILMRHCFEKENFILFDKGKTRGEHSLIYIKNGKYYGFGYMNTDNCVSSVEELEYAVKKREYYPDSDILVKGFMKNNPGKKIISIN